MEDGDQRNSVIILLDFNKKLKFRISDRVCSSCLDFAESVRLELICSDFLSAESSTWRFPFFNWFSIPSPRVLLSLAPA
jgi:hypothetical protein